MIKLLLVEKTKNKVVYAVYPNKDDKCVAIIEVELGGKFKFNIKKDYGIYSMHKSMAVQRLCQMFKSNKFPDSAVHACY